MKLKDCKYGVLVFNTNTSEIGMIKGITNNITVATINKRSDPRVAIPLVAWQSGSTTGIHHDNLSLLKDERTVAL